MQNPDISQTQPTPSTPTPPPSIFDNAAASIRACAPEDQLPDLAALADALERALYSDCIFDPDDSAAMLAVQARTMDALFSALVCHGFRDKRFPDEYKLRLAIHAQRQSATTIDRLKRHQSREKSLDFRINREFHKQTEGGGK